MSFLHGSETIEVKKGAVPVTVVKAAVIGLIGTAPKGPLNTPTLVLSDADAAAVAQNQLPSRGTRYITRTQQAPSSIPNSPPPPGSAGNAGTPQLEHCPESLEALFAFKSRLDAKTPFVVNNEPAVLAWYPTARAALLWNPSEDRKTFAIRFKNATREVTLQGLDSALLQDLV